MLATTISLKLRNNGALRMHVVKMSVNYRHFLFATSLALRFKNIFLFNK